MRVGNQYPPLRTTSGTSKERRVRLVPHPWLSLLPTVASRWTLLCPEKLGRGMQYPLTVRVKRPYPSGTHTLKVWCERDLALELRSWVPERILGMPYTVRHNNRREERVYPDGTIVTYTW